MGEAKILQTPAMKAQADAVLKAQLQGLCIGLDDVLNGADARTPQAKNGLVLLVFPFGATGERVNYISNCQRKDVLVALKEIVARFEGQPRVVGRA